MSSESPPLVRLGLIGAGRWGRNFIRTIQGLDNVVLSVLCSRNPDSRNLVDSRCKLVSDWHDLLGTNLCDGVIIATPPDSHAEILAAMIRARLPSLVEKPLTLDLQQALDLQHLLQKQPTPVLVDHIFLFHPAFVELKRLSAGFGPIRSIQSEGGNHGPFRPNYSALWDYGPHDISMSLDLLKTPPQRITCHASETSEGGRYELDLVFPNGVPASITVSNLAPAKIRTFTVRHQAHVLAFNDLLPQKLWLDGAPVAVVERPPLAVAVETLVSGIGGRETGPFGLNLSVEVVRTLHSAQLSLGR